MVYQQYSNNSNNKSANKVKAEISEGLGTLTKEARVPNLGPILRDKFGATTCSYVMAVTEIDRAEGITSFQSTQSVPSLLTSQIAPTIIKKKPPAPLPKPDMKKERNENIITNKAELSTINSPSATLAKKMEVIDTQQMKGASKINLADIKEITSLHVQNSTSSQSTIAEAYNTSTSESEEIITKFPNSFVATKRKKNVSESADKNHDYQPSMTSNSLNSSGENSSRTSIIFETEEEIISPQTLENTPSNSQFQLNRPFGYLFSRSSTRSSSSSGSPVSSRSSVYSGGSPILSKTASPSGHSTILMSPSTSSLSSSSSHGISSLDLSSASLILNEGRCAISIPVVPEYDEINASSCDKCSEGKCRTIYLQIPELPFGWEKVEDPHYGVYYIDHVNRRTQYESPTNTVKAPAASAYTGEEITNTFPRPKKTSEASAKRSASENNMHGQLHSSPNGRQFFTKDPGELKGEFTQTSLVKSARGLGFTIIGGNQRNTQFLQIKNVVDNGPAFISGKFRSGDVIVRVNNTCVLGFTHQDVVRLFQSIAPGETVHLETCRGYPLNFDPNDPNTEIVTTVAVASPHYGSPVNGQSLQNGIMDYINPYNPQLGLKSLPDLTRTTLCQGHSSTFNISPSRNHEESEITSVVTHDDAVPDLVSLSIHSKPEVLTIAIVKGPMGFGFTIADSPYGQRVKQILDQSRCKNLAEGDLILLINSVNVLELPHQQTVQFLKDCKQDQETVIVVQRRGIPPPPGKGKKNVLSHSFDERQQAESRAVSPGAYFFTNQDQNFHEQLQDNLPGNNGVRGDNEKSCIPTSALPPPIEEADEEADDADGGKQPNKSLPQDSQRPKTPMDNNRTAGTSNKIGSPMQQSYMEMNVSRRDCHDPNDFSKFNSNHSRADIEGNSMSRPPRGPSRPDFFPRFDPRLRNGDARGDLFQRNLLAMQSHDERWAHGRDVKPGQFRSRTPGPELMARGSGPDSGRPDIHRPKTPTAADMRSNGKPITSFGTGDFKSSGRFTPNPSSEQGRQYRSPYQDGRNWPEFSSHQNSDSFDSTSLNRSHVGEFPRLAFQNSVGPGRLIRQSTSFESDNPAPSTITRIPRKPPPHSTFQGHSAMSQSRIVTDDNGVQVMEMLVTLHRQESGYGFRIIGGTEENSPVSVGHIVPGGAADLEGRLGQNDEITHVDGCSVLGASHHKVVELMTNAALNGRVTLSIKRVLGPADGKQNETIAPQYPYDVVVSRRENEGFGFVIISSVNKSGASVDEFIGHIQENSPAARCGRLHVGDRILAVNGVDTSNMHHKDVVSIIKDSGFSVALTIGPPPDNSSVSQKSSGASNTVNHTDKLYMNIQSWERNQPGMSRDLGRPRASSNKSSDESEELYQVELNRGSRGFGFSIRGGREFNAMPLYVLRIAEGGAADVDGRLRVGDQILEINSYGTDNMTHTEAIEIIQNGGLSVKLLMRRTNKPPPIFEGPPSSPGSVSQGRHFFPNIPPVVNGPISHSSPHMTRRQIQQHQQPLPPPPPELQLPNNDYFPPPPTAAQSSLPRQRLNNY